MKRIITFYTLAVLIGSIVPVIGATDSNMDFIKTVDPYIDTIETFGNWEQKDNKGEFRYILTRSGFETVLANLYIQMVSEPEENKEKEIIKTIFIKEINVYNISKPIITEKENYYLLQLKAINVYNLKEEIIEIQLFKDCTYKILKS